MVTVEYIKYIVYFQFKFSGRNPYSLITLIEYLPYSMLSSQAAAGLLGATGVSLGAFGAHALKATLERRGTLSSWQTAVSYQLLHAVALLQLALSNNNNQGGAADGEGDSDRFAMTSRLWFWGVALFSGSIYGLSLGGPKILGPITPIGGLLMISGWASLMF